MYNYMNSRGNYNYVNNNYNIPSFEQNSNLQDFTPYEGFIRGNLFKELYNSYKIDNPYEIKPMNEQAELLTYIDSLYFAMLELNLYLDIHPENKEAISKYNLYRSNLNEYMLAYQNKYGPLTTTSDSLESYPWSWNDSPWPWEGKN